MYQEIEKIEQIALQEIEAASPQELEGLRVKYLGRKSAINRFFAEMSRLTPEEKASCGQRLNVLKKKIDAKLQEKAHYCGGGEKKIDVTFPAKEINFGRKHILSATNEQICAIFENIGFTIVEGNEIEDEWHNFSALNIPLDHPSREAFDTFYLDAKPAPGKKESSRGQYLLRSHTSPSQIRVMEKIKPPLAVISPGRVYRPDKVDASHSSMFHQIEGFCVDEHINFSQLKGVLLHFAKCFFSPHVRLRFRPHFFPFTEPSAEVDVSCMICGGKGCSVCSQKGWLEILGCGMIHPETLKACGISAAKYQGFAFGMGVERIAMLRFGIHDIRLFLENDTRFINQFYEV